MNEKRMKCTADRPKNDILTADLLLGTQNNMDVNLCKTLICFCSNLPVLFR